MERHQKVKFEQPYPTKTLDIVHCILRYCKNSNKNISRILFVHNSNLGNNA